MWKNCDEKVFPILGLGWTCMNSYGSRSNLSFPQGTRSLESIVSTSVWRALILIPCLETLSCMSSALSGPSPSVSDLVQLLTYRSVRERHRHEIHSENLQYKPCASPVLIYLISMRIHARPHHTVTAPSYPCNEEYLNWLLALQDLANLS
jgi:hypothetical protein